MQYSSFKYRSCKESIQQKVQTLAGTLFLSAVLCSLCAFCSSWGDVTLLNKGFKVRIYAVNADDFPSGEHTDDLPPARAFPKINLTQVRGLLGSLRFYDHKVSSHHSQPVFYHDDLDYLAPRLTQAIRRTKKGQRIIIIYKSTPPGNLIQTILRNTMAMWHDKQGVNILLGEVRTPLLSNDLIHQYSDWEDTDPINVNEPIAGISLEMRPPYRRKLLSGLAHETWALISVNDISSLLKKRSKAKVEKKSKKPLKPKKTKTKSRADSTESTKETKAKSKAKSSESAKETKAKSKADSSESAKETKAESKAKSSESAKETKAKSKANSGK